MRVRGAMLLDKSRGCYVGVLWGVGGGFNGENIMEGGTLYMAWVCTLARGVHGYRGWGRGI